MDGTQESRDAGEELAGVIAVLEKIPKSWDGSSLGVVVRSSDSSSVRWSGKTIGGCDVYGQQGDLAAVHGPVQHRR
jgi:hypothetical protein